MKTAKEFEIRIKAGYRIIGLETRDDKAAESVIDEVAHTHGWNPFWFRHAKDEGGENPFGMTDRTGALADLLEKWLAEKPAAMLVLRDVGEELGNPEIVAWLKECAEREDSPAGVIAVVGRTVEFRRELDGLSCVLEVAYPEADEIEAAVADFGEANGCDLSGGGIKAIAAALKGVPGCTIPRLLGTVFHREGRLDVHDILQEKTKALRRGGLLEPVDVSSGGGEAGGMPNLRGYLTHVSRILTHPEEARACGVDMPKGVLIAGMPGCGKSLAAKLAARMFSLPLLRLDTGRLMGKYNGDSERNLREALSMAEALAPCVLWIDEIEKAFAGVGKDSDNGVATRLFGGFLTWMNERTTPVYTIATANGIHGLPPELMRRGRFDELFFVDFPDKAEAAEILRQHLRRRGHALPQAEIDALAQEASRRGFSGADLEGAVKTGIELAFERRLANRKGKYGTHEGMDIGIGDFREAFSMAKSTSESMGPKVKELREKLKEFNLTPASEKASRRGATKAASHG